MPMCALQAGNTAGASSGATGRGEGTAGGASGLGLLDDIEDLDEATVWDMIRKKEEEEQQAKEREQREAKKEEEMDPEKVRDLLWMRSGPSSLHHFHLG